MKVQIIGQRSRSQFKKKQHNFHGLCISESTYCLHISTSCISFAFGIPIHADVTSKGKNIAPDCQWPVWQSVVTYKLQGASMQVSYFCHWQVCSLQRQVVSFSGVSLDWLREDMCSIQTWFLYCQLDFHESVSLFHLQ